MLRFNVWKISAVALLLTALAGCKVDPPFPPTIWPTDKPLIKSYYSVYKGHTVASAYFYYDAYGRLIKEVDTLFGASNSTATHLYTYGFSYVIRQHAYVPDTTGWATDTAALDAQGRLVTQTYDAEGHLLANGPVTNQWINGNLIRSYNNGNLIAVFEYDLYHRNTIGLQNMGIRFNGTDALNPVTKQATGWGNNTYTDSYTYDSLQRITTRQSKNGTVTYYSYQ
jgi:hypothetical protein